MAKRTGDEASPGTVPAMARKVPEFATMETGSSHAMIDASPPFVLVHSPHRFGVLAGKLVPMLGRMPLMPGVNHIEIDGQGRVKFAAARAKLEEEGRILIPYAWAPDGVSYIQAVDTKPTGKEVLEGWITVWETAHTGDTRTVSDLDGYASWLEGLIKAGKLQPCAPHIIERLLDSATERLNMSAAEAERAGGGPLAVRVQQLQVAVDVLTAAMAGTRGAPAARKATAAPDLE